MSQLVAVEAVLLTLQLAVALELELGLELGLALELTWEAKQLVNRSL